MSRMLCTNSVSNGFLIQAHMLQTPFRDETFVTLNSVMTLLHSRKRDKIYLKKLFYLRNFLSLLQCYRLYLSWKHLRRFQNRLAYNSSALDWKCSTLKFKWNSSVYQPQVRTTVIFRYYQCQLTITYVIMLPCLFLYGIVSIDKVFHLQCERKTFSSTYIIC